MPSRIILKNLKDKRSFRYEGNWNRAADRRPGPGGNPEGEVIFKKYSLLGGVEDFAAELCETMSRSTGSVCAVTDRDTVIAVAGGSKRELMGKRITPELEQIMESRKIYQYTGEGQPLQVTEGIDSLLTTVAAPILAEGDLLGLVLFISSDPAAVTGDTEYKLAQTIAAFLGRHMES